MDDDLKKIIRNSGNNLHMDIVKKLEENGWDVDLSSYYYDDTANKPREIDIMARKDCSEADSTGTRYSFFTFLFIECKYLKNEVAFRMHENNRRDSRSAIIIQGSNLDRDSIFKTDLSHHYLTRDRLAKLYDTEDQAIIFSSITQPIKSLTFFKDSYPNVGLYYPVVVYDGLPGIYSIAPRFNLDDLDSVAPQKNVLVGVNYSYRNVFTGNLRG